VGYREGISTLSVTYTNSSKGELIAISYANTLRVNAVLINPETQRHVRIGEKVNDSTTRYTSVGIAVATVKSDVDFASDRVGSHEVNSVRSADRNDSVKHVVNVLS